MSNEEKFTKVCCVCRVTGRIPECECVCHGSAAEKALAETKRDFEMDASWLEEIANLADETAPDGNQTMWPETKENMLDIAKYVRVIPKMRRALEAVLALPQSQWNNNNYREGWNHALAAMRSAIEHELWPFAPEDGKHE